jgi:hypothetical protein
MGARALEKAVSTLNLGAQTQHCDNSGSRRDSVNTSSLDYNRLHFFKHVVDCVSGEYGSRYLRTRESISTGSFIISNRQESKRDASQVATLWTQVGDVRSGARHHLRASIQLIR